MVCCSKSLDGVSSSEEILSVSAGIEFNDGTVSEPSIRFTDDTDTGIFRSADNTLNISTGGTERLEIDGTSINSTVPIVATQLTIDQVDINAGLITYSGTTGNNQIVIPDNLADGFSIQESTNKYITFVSTNASEAVNILKNTTISADLTATGVIYNDANFYLTISGGNPILGFDALDYMTYNRGSNYIEFYNAGAAVGRITSAGSSWNNIIVDQVDINGGIITFSGTTGNNKLVIPDAKDEGLNIDDSGGNTFMNFNTNAEKIDIQKKIFMPIDSSTAIYIQDSTSTTDKFLIDTTTPAMVSYMPSRVVTTNASAFIVQNATPTTLFKVDTSGNGSTLCDTYFVDSTAYLALNSGNPVLAFDANDYMSFTRSSNLLQTICGSVSQMEISASGVIVGAPTGSFQGSGTINAVSVFDDSVQLVSDYVFEQFLDNAIDVQKWDNKVLNRFVKNEETGIIAEEVRIHEPLRKFQSRINGDYDPLDIDKYAQHWKDKRHLSSLPNYNVNQPKHSLGQHQQSLIETVEILAIHIDNLNQRLKALE